MSTKPIDRNQLKALRGAALFYFLMTVTAPISLIYVPGKLIVPGDAAATVDRIRSSESLLRIGIGCELFHQAIALFLVLALYRLFRPVDEKNAKLLVVLGALVSVPIMFLNVLNEIATLTLLSGADFLSGFTKSQLDALAYLFITLHGHGIEITAVFWGLWLFPFGFLVIRSGFMPRILGFLLFIAGAGYLASSSAALVLPQYANLIEQISMVLEFGELPTVFWFLFRGLWPPKVEERMLDNERALHPRPRT
jgi:hypothetical protein